MLTKYRPIVAVLILLITTVLFVRYFQTHPQYWLILRHLSPWVIVWVVLLNVLMTVVLVGLNVANLALCGKRIKTKEMFLLTIYSSIANFFGPLQSGPGVRAAYLKTKYHVRLRDYTLASLIVLGMYAMWSILFLVVGNRPWWQTIGVLIVCGGLAWLAIRWFRLRDTQSTTSQFRMSAKVLGAITILTLLQVCVIAAWYFVELRAVDHSIHVRQALAYTGAANFSLFVSITPDAIGIREAFLIFSQHLHHVPTKDIVDANVIDRAVYVVYLLLLFGLALSMHARQFLQIKKLRR